MTNKKMINSNQRKNLFSFYLPIRVTIFFFFSGFFAAPPLRFQIFFEFCCGGFFFTLRQCLIQEFRFQDWGVSCFCAQKFFSPADQGHWELYFFCGAKKNQTNGAAGKKKFRARCKNLAFSAQSHTSNPFLRSKKGKMAPQAKKN